MMKTVLPSIFLQNTIIGLSAQSLFLKVESEEHSWVAQNMFLKPRNSISVEI